MLRRRGSLLGGGAGSSLGLGRSARPRHRSDVSISTHRPYCSVYSDPPQTPPLEDLGLPEVLPSGSMVI